MSVPRVEREDEAKNENPDKLAILCEIVREYLNAESSQQTILSGLSCGFPVQIPDEYYDLISGISEDNASLLFKTLASHHVMSTVLKHAISSIQANIRPKSAFQNKLSSSKDLWDRFGETAISAFRLEHDLISETLFSLQVLYTKDLTDKLSTSVLEILFAFLGSIWDVFHWSSLETGKLN